MAIVFLVALFVIKNQTFYSPQTTETSQEKNQTEGLTYGNESIGELVNKDTDGDGVLDWEEGLWGTDPTKKDTDDDGILDNIEIEKLKASQKSEAESLSTNETKKLTETEKLADQFFTTIVALEQNGSLNEATIDQITSSFIENLPTTKQRKIYTIKNIKISSDESRATIQAYNIRLQALQAKYPLNENVEAILLKSVTDNGEVDASVFKKLNPLINQLNGIVKEMLTINPPKSLAILHVMIINGFQKLSENLSDIQLTDTDAVLAFSAINQYEKNSQTLQLYVTQLISAVGQKLSN